MADSWVRLQEQRPAMCESTNVCQIEQAETINHTSISGIDPCFSCMIYQNHKQKRLQINFTWIHPTQLSMWYSLTSKNNAYILRIREEWRSVILVDLNRSEKHSSDQFGLLSWCLVSPGCLCLSLVQRKHTCLKLRGEISCFYLNKQASRQPLSKALYCFCLPLHHHLPFIRGIQLSWWFINSFKLELNWINSLDAWRLTRSLLPGLWTV